MKKCVCSAAVSDEKKRENLCECVRILGGFPIECGDEVSVVYAGEKATVMALVFQQYQGSVVWCGGDDDVELPKAQEKE